MLSLSKPPRLLAFSSIPCLAPRCHHQKRRSGPPRPFSGGKTATRTSAHQYHALAVNPTTHFFTSSIPGAAHRTKPVGFDEEPCTLTLTDGYGYARVEIGDRWGTQNEYEVVRKLGWGMFATTWLVYSHRLKKYYALKIVNEYGTFLETNTAARAFEHPRFHEREILERISTPSKPSGRGPKQCLRLVESFYTRRGTAQHLCLVLELGGMDLDSLRSAISPDNYALHPDLVKSIVKQLCIALNYLHTECKVVHTDLKPGNILFGLTSQEAKRLAKSSLLHIPPERYPPRRVMGDTVQALKSQALPLTLPNNDLEPTRRLTLEDMLRWKFKIADFGSAQWLGRRSTNLVQPIRLRAPEVLWEQEWDEKIDIWSLGCLTFEFLTGKPLFPAPHPDEENEIDSQKLKIYALSGGNPAYFNQSSSFNVLRVRQAVVTYPKPLAEALRRHKTAPINDSSAFSKEDREQALAFIARCLAPNPRHRASAKELLRDPWIRNFKAPARNKTPREKGGTSKSSSRMRLGVCDQVDKSTLYDRGFPLIQ